MQHQHRGVSFREPIGRGRHRVDDQAVPVLNEEMAQI
jgi:hypothetical protein